MIAGAIISDCEAFRYRLWRIWDPRLLTLVWVMLNPSKADADRSDHTMAKCVGFAKLLGFGGIEILNLYAYRATDPRDLRTAKFPVGPDNDRHILEAFSERGLLEPGGGLAVCAWGRNAQGHGRAEQMLSMLDYLGIEAMALRVSPDGTPHHPLTLPYTCEPFALHAARQHAAEHNALWHPKI